MHAITYGQTIARRVSLTLRRDDGALAGSCTVPGAELPDRGWLALDLAAPEPDSAGRTYTLEITADGARGGSAPTFGLTATVHEPSGVCGVASLDGAPLDDALALRGFADWRPALGVDDAVTASIITEDGASPAPRAATTATAFARNEEHA